MIKTLAIIKQQKMNFLGESVLDQHGPKGATGPTGPNGVDGVAGQTGPTGPIGPTGPSISEWGQINDWGPDVVQSGSLSNTVYTRFIPPINDPTSLPYFNDSSSNVNVIDNTAFELVEAGTYRVRYRLSLQSQAAAQNIFLILRINGIDVDSSVQGALVDSTSITTMDYEYLFQTTNPNERVYIFAKMESVSTPIDIKYLHFSIHSI